MQTKRSLIAYGSRWRGQALQLLSVAPPDKEETMQPLTEEAILAIIDRVAEKTEQPKACVRVTYSLDVDAEKEGTPPCPWEVSLSVPRKRSRRGDHAAINGHGATLDEAADDTIEGYQRRRERGDV